MADDVTYIECKRPNVVTQGGVAPVLGEIVTTQVVDVAVRSAKFNVDTRTVRVKNRSAAEIWFRQGGSSVNAAADTNGNFSLEAGEFYDLSVTPGFEYIDSAADA